MALRVFVNVNTMKIKPDNTSDFFTAMPRPEYPFSPLCMTTESVLRVVSASYLEER